VDENDLVVVAFDGDCLMCSRSIRFLAEHDPRRRFRFVTLQSARGQAMERQAGTGALDTALVQTGGRVHARSEAVLRILSALGGGWRLLGGLGRCLPRFLRDAVYDFIARRRHTWFGRGNACAMPSEALRERLL
jgi:predicted DCC family thiol-disulfide oxidoreductase YuxK